MACVHVATVSYFTLERFFSCYWRVFLSYLMALDQGTSSSRAIIYSADGRTVAVAQRPLASDYPADGWVEQDPEALWDGVVATGREALNQAQLAAGDIAAIGITNQRETTLVWDRQTSECVYNAIVWQDRRTASFCEEIRSTDYQPPDGQDINISELIANQTGLVIDPYFSSTKLAWILHHTYVGEDLLARARLGELCFGTVDSFLIWRLSKGAAHRTDASNASRTQLFDIHRQTWSPELLQFFDIPSEMLPEVVDNAGAIAVADAEWFGARIPICGVAGDQQSALIGQGCLSPGKTKSTYGTGCFVMANTGSTAVISKQKLLTTVAYRLDGKTTYALEGSIFVAGVAVQWARDQMGLIDDAAETATAYAATKGDAGGVFMVPAFTGLGAPYWAPEVRGLITGLSLNTNRQQVLTALLQAVGFQTQELLEAMGADGAPVAKLRVDGGMSVNDALCQFLADILDTPVERPEDVETTALGAAMLAGLGVGLYDSLDAAEEVWRLDQHFAPEMQASRRQSLLHGYAAAVRQALAGVGE